jgi:GntR family transcriptional regulator
MHWDDRQPIYRQLADQLAGRLLDGEPREGEAMPSVRVLASSYLLNPSPWEALQALSDDGLLENRRGLGLLCGPGHANTCACWSGSAFSNRNGPSCLRLRRLGLRPEELDWEA